jgi:hypothetical protein
MSNSHAAIKLLTTVLLTVATAFPQSSDRLTVTDAEKIASAMQAGNEVALICLFGTRGP